MKPSAYRRIRRRTAGHEAVSFKKDNQQEQSFFGDVMHEPFFKGATPGTPAATIQRKCAGCEKENKIQRNTENKDDKLMKKEAAPSAAGPSPTASQYVGSINSKGQSMDAGLRSFYESRMGADFSKVKIHTGKEAAESAKDINAQAYVYGNHIVFDEGRYQPGSGEGKYLLAHELAHVMQQEGISLQGLFLFRTANFKTANPVYNVNLAGQFIKAVKGDPDNEFGSTHPLINAVDLTASSTNPIKIPADSDLSTVSIGNDFESSVTTIPTNETSFRMRLPQRGVTKWTKAAAVSDLSGILQNLNCTSSNTNVEVTGHPNVSSIVTKTKTHEDVHAQDISDCHTDYIVKFDQFLSTRKAKAATEAASKRNLLTTIRGMAAAMLSGFASAFTQKANTFHGGRTGRKGNLAITNITQNCSKIEVRATN